MYESFYGLTSKPFQLNPDPSFYFDSKQHRRAKAYLDYGVMRNEGFIVITGEIGAGKTTILGGLLNSLNRNEVVVGQLVTTQLDAEDTLRMVAAAFGFQAKGVHKSELLVTLEAFLISQASAGKRCLLVVDEAQNLTPRAVEELRMLSNYQLGNQSLLQSFLVGQPEFREILQRPEMEQFRQRVAATCHIGPLDLEDTRHYIEHRLKRAGAQAKPQIDDDAFTSIFNASQGVPRRINSLCDRLMLLGFLANRTHLTAADVDEVVREFAKEAGAPVARPSTLPASAMPGSLGSVVNPATAATATAVAAEALNGHAVQRMSLEPTTADAFTKDLETLSLEQHGDRLQRLERSMLRLERINLETLRIMQELIRAVRQPSEGKES